jgi:predicted methyltransferase
MILQFSPLAELGRKSCNGYGVRTSSVREILELWKELEKNMLNVSVDISQSRITRENDVPGVLTIGFNYGVLDN